MKNRKQSKATRHSLVLIARAWETRWVILLALTYLGSFAWLFTAGTSEDIRPSEILVTPADPEWKGPGQDHWFGTTSTGLDLFNLCRISMAQTIALAALASGLGLGLAFLAVMLFAFDPGEKRFSLMKSFGRIGKLIPCALILLIILAGSGGGIAALVATTALLVAWHIGPTLAVWFEDSENRPDVVSAYVVGLSRSEIVTNRVVPSTLRKMVGVFACLIPQIALLEMGLSYLGFGSERLSIGGLVAYGQEVIIEAPWLAIYPGVFATIVLIVMGVLGWLASRLLKTGRVGRFL
ncbi:MAG: hypothetical protein P1U58_18870 [Verrucomicrobiales bacterium]|nr:hypothetical protein [Verrucomicrobiales bacterium]